MADMPKVTVFPSIRKEGRIPSNEPKRTMNAVARMNISTEIIAWRLFFTSSIFTFLPSKYPSAMRFWYSGSSISSFPTRMEHNAPTSTPRIVAGIVILRISNKVMSNPASRPSSATVAAEIGLAVMACCEAITAIPNGRSGLILVSVATSAMTGRTE